MRPFHVWLHASAFGRDVHGAKSFPHPGSRDTRKSAFLEPDWFVAAGSRAHASHQVRAGQARELHRAFVWFVFPRMQAIREVDWLCCI